MLLRSELNNNIIFAFINNFFYIFDHINLTKLKLCFKAFHQNYLFSNPKLQIAY